MTNKSPDELIAEIKAVREELAELGVTRHEYINFRRLSAEDLEQELDAVSEQLERRKKFLGVG